MSEFLSQWHRIAEADDTERALAQRRLEHALNESSAIRELAGNPLLLTMMSILNRNQELPRNRVALYREASRVLLDDWDARKALPVGEFDREDKEALLRELAGYMQQAEGGLAGNLIEHARLREQIRRFLEALAVPESRRKSNLLVKQLAERNFILAYAGAGRFCFVHRTFLEYFCADWFVHRFQVKQDLTLEQLKTEVFGHHWKEEKWHEVLRLIVGMVEEKKAEELIRFLVARDVGDEAPINLMLAAGCVNEVRNRGAIQATVQAVWKCLEEEAIRWTPPKVRDGKDDRKAAEQIRRWAVQSMAQVWRGDDAQAWLRSASVKDPDSVIRQEAIRQLAGGWRDDPSTIQLVRDRARNDKAWEVRFLALLESQRGPGDRANFCDQMLESARNDEHHIIREIAAHLLAQNERDDPRTLPLLFDLVAHDDEWVVRSAVVAELVRGWKGDPDVILTLTDRARNDPNENVRRDTIQELGRFWGNDPITLKLAMELARGDKDPHVRNAAVEVLKSGWRGNPEVDGLLKSVASGPRFPAS
jgi:hypothetical protein